MSIYYKIKKIFRRQKLEKALKKQPYYFKYEDIIIKINRDVFPPDIGLASIDLANEIQKYKAKSALDMGTGTGFIAIMMAKHKIPNITAIDNHKPAIECCKENAKLNKQYSKFKIIHSDLFNEIEPNKLFDLIIFNHPYSPASNKIIFGNNKDGGKKICERFLLEAKKFLNENGVIIMSFTSIFGQNNDPLKIAREIGYTAKINKKRGILNKKSYIYEFKLK